MIDIDFDIEEPVIPLTRQIRKLFPGLDLDRPVQVDMSYWLDKNAQRAPVDDHRIKVLSGVRHQNIF